MSIIPGALHAMSQQIHQRVACNAPTIHQRVACNACYARATLGHCMRCPLYQGHCMQCPNKSINALRAMPVMPAQRWDIACNVHYTRGIACNAPTNPSTRCMQCLLCPRNVGTLHAMPIIPRALHAMSIIPGALRAMPQQIHQRIACNASTYILLYLFRYSIGLRPVIFRNIVRNALVSV
jgi:hypothetical protein